MAQPQIDQHLGELHCGPTGIEHAVKLARSAVDEDMVGRTAMALDEAGVLRSAPAGSVAAQ